jgi:DNA-binding transcriptional MerR regulator
MRMRVEELALAAEVSVDTVRYYQKQRLLPPPERSGRLAWYTSAHLDRIVHVKDLQRRGFSLAVIRRFLAGELDPADERLAAAVAEAGGGGAEELYDLAELGARTQVPAPLLELLVKEGILVPRRHGGEDRYTAADARAVAAGLRILELGFPLPDLLELARRYHAATRDFAARAVDLFDEHVRTPLLAADLPDEERAERMVAAFRALLPAVTTMVGHHFERTLLAVAQEHLEHVGEPAQAALAGAGLAGVAEGGSR